MTAWSSHLARLISKPQCVLAVCLKWQYSKLVLELEVAACRPACDSEGRPLPCAPLHCLRSSSRCADSSAVNSFWFGLGPEARERLGNTMDSQLARLFSVKTSLLRLGRAPSCSRRHRFSSEHCSESCSTAGCTTPLASGGAAIARPELQARASGGTPLSLPVAWLFMQERAECKENGIVAELNGLEL